MVEQVSHIVGLERLLLLTIPGVMSSHHKPVELIYVAFSVKNRFLHQRDMLKIVLLLVVPAQILHNCQTEVRDLHDALVSSFCIVVSTLA